MEDNQKLSRELLEEVVVTGKKKKRRWGSAQKEPRKVLSTSTIEFKPSTYEFKRSKPIDIPAITTYQPPKKQKIKTPKVITNYKPVQAIGLSKFKGAQPLVTNKKEIFSTYKQQLENLNK